MTQRFSYLLAVALALSLGTLHAQDVTGEEFKTKALAEWNALFERVRTVRWEYRREYYRSQNREPLRLLSKWVVRGAFNPNGSLFGSDIEDLIDENLKAKERSNELHIANQQYRADLKRTKDGDGWLLVQFQLGREEEEKDPKHRLSGFAFPWLVVGNVGILDWMQDSDFVIMRIEQRPADSSGTPLRVHFRYDKWGQPSTELPWHIRSGYIDFDPLHSYRPMGYEYQIKSKLSEYVERGTHAYETGTGIPVLKTKTTECPDMRSEKLGLRSYKEIHIYKIEYNVDVGDEEFRLSYYGLPEPAGVTWAKPVPVYVWLGVGAFVCLLLAVGSWRAARYFCRKRAAAQPAEA